MLETKFSMRRLLLLMILLVGVTFLSQAQSSSVTFHVNSPTQSPIQVPSTPVGVTISFNSTITKPSNANLTTFNNVIRIYAWTHENGIDPVLVHTSPVITDTNFLNGTNATYTYGNTFTLNQTQINHKLAALFARFETSDKTIQWSPNSTDFVQADLSSITQNDITAVTINIGGSGIPQVNGQATNGGGGAGSYTYSWESSTSCDLTTATWSPIAGATSINYHPTVAISTTTHYRRTVTSFDQTSTSAPVTVTVGPSSTISISGSAYYFPAPAVGGVSGYIVPAIDGNAALQNGMFYQWMSSTASATNGFTEISGLTSEDFPGASVSQTTYFKRVIKKVASGGCPAVTYDYYDNVVAVGAIKTNTIQFSAAPTLARRIYTTGSYTPDPIIGDTPTGIPTGLTPLYLWTEGFTIDSRHVVSGSDVSYTPGSTPENRYYVRELILNNSTGASIYSQNSNEVHVEVYAPLVDNDICCAQTVYGTAVPALIGSANSTTGGAPPLSFIWQMSTDNQVTWTTASGTPSGDGLHFQPSSGLSGNVYFRRFVIDGAVGSPNASHIGNSILINYVNTIPLGATMSNPIFTDGPFGTVVNGTDCLEVLRTQDENAAGFSNQTGYPGNEVYFRIFGAGTVIMNACWSSVPVKAYLYDASFNPITPTSVGGDCTVGLNLGVTNRIIYAMVEGETTNGTIKVQFYSANNGDCVDSYTGFLVFTGDGLQSDVQVVPSIYPNPTQNTATLRLSKANGATRTIQVYDKHNALVKTFQTTQDEVAFSVEDLTPDVYYVKVAGDKKSETHRLVVK